MSVNKEASTLIRAVSRLFRVDTSQKLNSTSNRVVLSPIKTRKTSSSYKLITKSTRSIHKSLPMAEEKHHDENTDFWLEEHDFIEQDRYRACMVLAAVGDAVGYKHGQWEFLTDGVQLHKEFRKLTKDEGMKALKLNKREWPCSDDTIMHIATAEALTSDSSKDYNLNEICTRIALEYKKCWTKMRGRAPGGTTAKAVGQLLKDGSNWNTIVYNESAGGCGASMRSACIGLKYWKPADQDNLIALSVESGRITHHNPTAYLGSYVSALFTAYAIRGYPCKTWGSRMIKSLPNVKKYIKNSNREVSENTGALGYFISHWNDYIKLRKLNGDSGPSFPTPYGIEEREEFYREISFSGWGGASGHDSVIIAYDALLGCNGDWNELCLRGVLHGGDSDSTGTIAAAWYGALYGFKGIAKQNYKHVEFADDCKKLGDKLYKQSQPKISLRKRLGRG